MNNSEEQLAPTPTSTRVVYRAALARDAADQAEVFYHAVMQGAATHYSLAERRAWAQALPREGECLGGAPSAVYHVNCYLRWPLRGVS
ncbi:hypothetical protein HSBAA_52870 [Vreelandella sulfidaeris]|uniref:Uncharacterized protein n=1 Tax=Vreelandella sulfidaeris TaxID=115553 RepID=A0A455UH60_9GAMM|nr:hypothetical protein HSBAA_52870 [Halomonas sulfidaeris]